jgi:hypothetical protein
MMAALTAATMTAALTACTDEADSPVASGEAATDEVNDGATVVFRCALPDEAAGATRNFGDGLNATYLYYAIYHVDDADSFEDRNGNYKQEDALADAERSLVETNIGDFRTGYPNEYALGSYPEFRSNLGSPETSLTPQVRFTRGDHYQIAFVAAAHDDYRYNSTFDGSKTTPYWIDGEYVETNEDYDFYCNDENLDIFAAVIDIKVPDDGSDIVELVGLTRIVAQVNVLISQEEWETMASRDKATIYNTKTSLVLEGVYNGTYSLFKNRYYANDSGYALFDFANINGRYGTTIYDDSWVAETFGDDYHLLATTYVLTDNRTCTVLFDMGLSDGTTIDETVTNVPIEPNCRTNIIFKNLMYEGVDAVVNIDLDYLDPNYDHSFTPEEEN